MWSVQWNKKYFGSDMERLAMPASKMATRLRTLVKKPKYRFLSVKLATCQLCFHWQKHGFDQCSSLFFFLVFSSQLTSMPMPTRLCFPARTVRHLICRPVPSDPSFSPRTRTFRRKLPMSQWKSKIFLAVPSKNDVYMYLKERLCPIKSNLDTCP